MLDRIPEVFYANGIQSWVNNLQLLKHQGLSKNKLTYLDLARFENGGKSLKL
jgi:hypothetical protein